MNILLIGSTGQLGSAVCAALAERGHEVVTVNRSSGDFRADMTNPQSVAALYDSVGVVDAVACAAGVVPYKTIQEMTAGDYASAYTEKVGGQIDLVRQGIHHVSHTGSFTLVTGVLGRIPIRTGTAAALANGAIEAFVRAAAVEIAPQRVNAVSPTIFTEALTVYGTFFPGIPSVDLAEVARAYVRSIEGIETGETFALD